MSTLTLHQVSLVSFLGKGISRIQNKMLTLGSLYSEESFKQSFTSNDKMCNGHESNFPFNMTYLFGRLCQQIWSMFGNMNVTIWPFDIFHASTELH